MIVKVGFNSSVAKNLFTEVLIKHGFVDRCMPLAGNYRKVIISTSKMAFTDGFLNDNERLPILPMNFIQGLQLLNKESFHTILSPDSLREFV